MDQKQRGKQELFGKEDKKGWIRFLTTLLLPFMLLGIGGVLLAGGVLVLLVGGPSFIWMSLLILGGVFVVAALVGFVVIMMMAEAGPF